MSFLYSCRHDGDQYRITKLTHNLDVESSYLCTFDECECPAGVRPTCRHREMLPRFVERGAISTGWMYDYDRGGWVDNRTEDELEPNPTATEIDNMPLPELHNSITEHLVDTTFKIMQDKGLMPTLPKGVQAFSLEDPAELHNAIAEAVGEPEAKLAPASKIGLKLNPNPEPGKGFVEFTTSLPPATWRRF